MNAIKNKMKYFLYARKSTESEDRQVLSLDSQVDEGTRLAYRDNISNFEIICESKSAKEPGRPLFSDMLDRIERGEANGIICWHLNRLSRNPIDAGRIQHLLQHRQIEMIITPSRTYLPGDNVLMMCLEFGMSIQYSRDLSDNVKRGLNKKVEQGCKNSLATIGYLNTKQAKGTNEIVADPATFDLTRKVFQMVLDGLPIAKTHQTANDELSWRYPDGRKISRTSYYRMLKDPFYYGWFESPKGSGIFHQGKHPPMITKQEFDQIQVLLGRNGNTRPKSYTFPFTGMIRCGECGASITAEYKKKEQKNGNTHLYTYYRCTKRIKPCSQKTIRQEDLEAQILGILERIHIPIEFRNWALEQLKLENETELKIQKQIDKNQQNLLSVVTRKMNRLTDMRINNELTEEEYAEKKAELQTEKMKLLEQSAVSQQHLQTWLDKAEFMMDFAETAKRRFENGSLETKRQILSLLGSNFLLTNGKLTIEVQKPILLMKEIEKECSMEGVRLEPAEILDTRTSNREYRVNCITWRGMWDSNSS